LCSPYLWAEKPVGPVAFMDEVQCNIIFSHFLFGLIQFKFQIKFKLLKVVET
jgi:hypothetical protein